ncbi:hypothetical protein NQ314_008622 [Rhamnusium bicolor]|uniref:MOG interacting and ectopic P-granules protein 1 n=1 Tax=Rhamnusium bicolor TaxID=1586634 RepID=A0AAV8YAL8_9CUCU|nr:hypothetical protein NQ314_008622 [Rhamnusium bicolor]
MAAVADMGEVDEMHSKEEGSVVVNGELPNDIDMENQDSQDSLKKASLSESMEVDESETENNEAKEISQESASMTEDSTEDSNTAEDSSIATENQSEVNEDESSQETKTSEDQAEEHEVVEDSEESDQEQTKIENKEKVEAHNEAELDKISRAGSTEIVAEKETQEVIDEKTVDDSSSKEKILEITEEDEVHEIESDEEDHIKGNKLSCNDEPIELNDSGGEGDGDTWMRHLRKKEQSKADSVTPRRSTRNLNKSKSYVESDKEEEVEDAEDVDDPTSPHSSEESDIEEVLPQDPLACSDAITVERVPAEKPKPLAKPPTIVVKDTKRLVEIASKTNNTTQGKKEPTLVIIDTNSILSGRGPVPVNNKPPPAITTSSYSPMLPMALPAQGMYPPNMRATITPIPINTSNIAPTPPPKTSPATITPTLPTPLLPTLTDDMFVVEAPSFIVPYVYEKPPVKDFKEFVKELQAQVLEQLKISEEKDKEKMKLKKEKEEDGEKIKQDEGLEKMETDQVEQSKKEEPKKELEDAKKPYSYFESPLGKFFINIGFNMVQEFVQSDLLRQQKRKRDREGGANPETEKNYKIVKTPHMKNFVYKCNFCPYEIRSPHDILFHMEAEHAVRGHLERAPAFHQCPNCPFEDNQKGKLSRHLVACMRKFKPDRNLEPPVDWEPPAKIPRVPKMRQQGLNATAAAYQAMSKTSQYQFLSKMQLQSTQQAMQRGRGRPSLGANVKPQTVLRPSGMVFKQQTMTGGSVLVPTNYQLSGNQVFQNANQGKKPSQQPSISITPLPRGTTATSSPVAPAKPGDTTSKNSFVICEICDGYIKDLEQLRNHMQWIHKIKIHPKMIYNRPPLNCQKCQFRFFTDQGLERHLLGSHGLVTSSMQDAANKSKDSGRCPVCGRVYQWKLLNHVARDHNMTLKPAHLSYKCTVCTATFGMYKQFENHVYSAHSVVAKRVMDKKSASSSPSVTNKTDMKPLKINDEITIIPQPAKSTNGASKEGSPSSTGSNNSRNSTPSTSKNSSDSTALSASRAEQLAWRNANEDD